MGVWQILSMKKPILHVNQLTTELRLGNSVYSVIEGMSFDLYKGETLALVGESGCGKSMTALSILRILPTPPFLPSRGEIFYNDQNLLALSESGMRKIRGARIAMIFQDPSNALNPVFTIGNQLLEVAELHLNLYGDDAKNLAVKMLSEVGVASAEERLYDYPHQLSGGMRQRVMIAMALMCEPDILIADEPTTALDVTIQAQVLEIIRREQKRRGMALLLITHDMGVVAEMADEVMVMYAGEGIERASVLELFDDMAHPYTQGLFLSQPSFGKGGEGALKAIQGTVPSLHQLPKGCRFHPRCPYCMSKCRSGEVKDFFPESNGSHMAKCWLWDGTPESILGLEAMRLERVEHE